MKSFFFNLIITFDGKKVDIFWKNARFLFYNKKNVENKNLVFPAEECKI